MTDLDWGERPRALDIALSALRRRVHNVNRKNVSMLPMQLIGKVPLTLRAFHYLQFFHACSFATTNIITLLSFVNSDPSVIKSKLLFYFSTADLKAVDPEYYSDIKM